MEPRGFCYNLALSLVRKTKREHPRSWHTDVRTINAILLLLYCWNFAARKTKKLNVAKIRNALQRNKKSLDQLQQYSLLDFDKINTKLISSIFASFRKTFGQTGASKVLSLLNPRLFVMWDTEIRRRLKKYIKGIGNGTRANQYVSFLNELCKYSKKHNIRKKLPTNAVLAKKLDEYHYVRLVLRMKRTGTGES
jgi:hypothetical protein